MEFSSQSPGTPVQELNLAWKDIESSTTDSMLLQVLNSSWKDIPTDLIEDSESLEELDEMQICDSTQAQQDALAHDNMNDSQVPSLSPFRGKYNFDFMLRNNGRYKPSWEYSSTFNQVFIDMNKVLMVQFIFDNPSQSYNEDLFIRALPVYCSTDHIGLPVNRCTIHAIEDDPGNEAHGSDDLCRCNFHNLVGHVVRSVSAGAIYFYNHQNKRHSVVMPVNCQPGTNSFDILYTFACKTSCQKGMQRRPIHVVFTLENGRCDVLGRISLAVKICSCPKRDRDRLEKDVEKTVPKTLHKKKANDPLSDDHDEMRDLKSKIKAELKQIHKLNHSLTKTTKNLEELLRQL